MKILVLLLSFITFNSWGQTCENRLPLSEVRKAIALEPNAGSKTCAQLPEEECVCHDGIQWEAAELEETNGGRHQLVNDPAKIDDLKRSQNQARQMEGAIVQATSAMDCGRRVMATLVVRNASKNLSTAQIRDMIQTYGPTKDMLETGSLTTARESIMAIEPDGTIVTEADKTALTAEIDRCRPQPAPTTQPAPTPGADEPAGE